MCQDTAAPGSQAVYVASEGYLGFTQAHSSSLPAGAIIGSFAHFQHGYDQYGYISKYTFGVRGFTACSVRTGAYGTNQIFTAFANATVQERQYLFLHRLWCCYRGLKQHPNKYTKDGMFSTLRQVWDLCHGIHLPSAMYLYRGPFCGKETILEIGL